MRRCLTLASRLREGGNQILFVCASLSGDLTALIAGEGFPVRAHELPQAVPGSLAEELASIGEHWEGDAEMTISAVSSFGSPADWVVVDHYAFDAKWERKIRQVANRVMAIDDLADRPHDCDLLLDQNLVDSAELRYSGKVPSSCTTLLGPKYALLRPEFAELHPSVRVRAGTVQRVLIYFGGADRTDQTGRTLAALLESRPDGIEVDVVVPSGTRQAASIERIAAARPNVHVHNNAPSLAPMMAAADLAFGAGGATTWERLCMGLPSLVVTIAENQRPIARELARRGLVRWLGDDFVVDARALSMAVDAVLSEGLDPHWSSRCLSIVDGKGAARVCAIIGVTSESPLIARDANLHDELLLFEWVNDPLVRRNSFADINVTIERHSVWLVARLAAPEDCQLYIIETPDGIPIGQTRFDRRAGRWEIDYTVGPAFRGRGLGRAVLATGIAKLAGRTPQAVVTGRVKGGNLASRKIFESLHFDSEIESGDEPVFRYVRAARS